MPWHFRAPYTGYKIWASFGQFGVHFLAHKGMNGSKTCTVGQHLPILGIFEDLRAILGQFRPIWAFN